MGETGRSSLLTGAGEPRSVFTVTDAAQRPALEDGACFYCRQPVGEKHLVDCVLVKRKVRVRLTIEYEVAVPASWSPGDVEFHRNDSSWCANNAIHELRKIQDDGSCICDIAQFECVGAGADGGQPFLSER